MASQSSWRVQILLCNMYDYEKSIEHVWPEEDVSELEDILTNHDGRTDGQTDRSTDRRGHIQRYKDASNKAERSGDGQQLLIMLCTSHRISSVFFAIMNSNLPFAYGACCSQSPMRNFLFVRIARTHFLHYLFSSTISKIAFLPPPLINALIEKFVIGPKFKGRRISFQTSPIF